MHQQQLKYERTLLIAFLYYEITIQVKTGDFVEISHPGAEKSGKVVSVDDDAETATVELADGTLVEEIPFMQLTVS